jgi:hypothetical protein
MKKASDILVGALETEFKTVKAMMEIFCKQQHGSKALCDSCKALLTYAEIKLDRCPYGESKPTCNKCPIHCYKPEQKQQMKAVMRYAGPRMLLPHPILSIRHLIHERRDVPSKPEAGSSNRALRKAKQKDKLK